MHAECSELLLTNYSIPDEDRPVVEDKVESNTEVVFCTKGCFSKWRTSKNKEIRAAAAAAKEAARKDKKKKIPWEEDGSLDVLLEWLTTEGNHASCCGAAGNKGRTKGAFCKEIAKTIKEKKPETDRSEKDVENKIVKLERQFRLACDWTMNTGQGVSNPGDFEAAVKQRCPLFHELEDIMGSRPNAKPLSANENDVPIVDDDAL